MKNKNFKFYLMFFLFICSYLSYSQISNSWSQIELNKANTVNNISYLNDTEKEAVIILNLARLYPKKFVQIELIDFNGTKKYGEYLKDSYYKKSLIRTMNKMKPLSALVPDSLMTINAKCFAVESGKRGYEGHKRINCEKKNFAECCSYGMETGKDIIMQLLIDHNVPSLGHRKGCFDETLTTIGVGVASHKKWDTCCVIELY